jgi:hypothetical protein
VRVVGEVANDSGVSVSDGQVTIVAGGTTPMTFTPATSLAVLQPGEVSGFAQEFRMPPGYTSSAATGASGSVAAAPGNHLFTTAITSADTTQVSGTVVNDDAATAHLVRVDVTFFDGGGRTVDVGGTLVGDASGSLAPGASTQFTVSRRAGAPLASTVATVAEAESGPARAASAECPALRALSTGATVTGGGGYHPLPAARIMDTRPASGAAYAGHALCGVAAPSSLELQIAGVGGVPAQGVSAVFLTVTATNATVGYATVFPAGTPAPTASNLNFSPGKTLAQLVEVPLGQGGRITLTGSTPHADLIVDVSGYVDGNGSGGALAPLTPPQRLADTRAGSGYPKLGGTLGPGESRSLAVTNSAGGPAAVPGSAQAVILNVTAVAPTANTFLTVSGTAPRPATSNLNAQRGEVISDRVISPVDAAGQVTIYNNLGQTDVVVDLIGYVAAAPTSGSGQLHSVVPHRVADTRPGSGQPYAGQTLIPSRPLDVAVRGQGGVASTATAVLAVLTGTDTSTSSYALAYAPGGSVPPVSDVNWSARRTVPNLVLVPLNSTGNVRLAIGRGSANLILDVVGYLD